MYKVRSSVKQCFIFYNNSKNCYIFATKTVVGWKMLTCHKRNNLHCAAGRNWIVITELTNSVNTKVFKNLKNTSIL